MVCPFGNIESLNLNISFLQQKQRRPESVSLLKRTFRVNDVYEKENIGKIHIYETKSFRIIILHNRNLQRLWNKQQRKRSDESEVSLYPCIGCG